MILTELKSSTAEKICTSLRDSKWLEEQGENICCEAFLHVISCAREKGDAETDRCIYFFSFSQDCQYIAREPGIWKHLLCCGVLTVFLLREESLNFC